MTKDLSGCMAERLDSAHFDLQSRLRQRSVVSEVGHITLLCFTFPLSVIDKDEGNNGADQPLKPV